MLTANLLQFVSLHVPLECLETSRLQNVTWDSSNDCHTAATLASLIDSLLLPTRACGTRGVDISQLCSSVLGDGSAGKLAYVTAKTYGDGLRIQPGSAARFIQDIDYFDQEVVSEGFVLRKSNSNGPTEPISFVHTLSKSPLQLPENLSCEQSKRLNWFSIVPIPMPIPDKYPLTLSPLNDKMSGLSILVQIRSSKSFKNVFRKHQQILQQLKSTGSNETFEDIYQTEELLKDFESDFN